MRRLRLTIAVMMLVVAGCSDDEQPLVPPASGPEPPGQPSLSVEELLAAPDSLVVEGIPISVEVSLGRDFMPGTPEGEGVAAVAVVTAPPPGALPYSVSDIYIWAIRDSSEVWSATMELQVRYPKGGYLYWAGYGPTWDPGISVDVVIGARTSADSVTLVLLPNQAIQAVY